MYQLTDDQALQETEASMAAAAAAADGGVHVCKDPDVVDASGLDLDQFEEGAAKKGGMVAAGRRPQAADDSAHAGRFMFASKP